MQFDTQNTHCIDMFAINPECYYFSGDISFFIEVLFQFLNQALNKGVGMIRAEIGLKNRQIINETYKRSISISVYYG
jgi:hypothetical protein